MAWNNIAKPTGPTWNTTNPLGRERYDQADIEYDSATTFYDGVSPSQWTEVSKPSTNNWQNIAKPN